MRFNVASTATSANAASSSVPASRRTEIMTIVDAFAARLYSFCRRAAADLIPDVNGGGGSRGMRCQRDAFPVDRSAAGG